MSRAMSPRATSYADWLLELATLHPFNPVPVWQGGGYALSTWRTGQEVSTYQRNLAACEAALARMPHRDRYLIVSTSTVKVEIYLHPGEDIRTALEQCEAELAVDDLGFDSPEEEALARRAVPELLAELRKGDAR